MPGTKGIKLVILLSLLVTGFGCARNLQQQKTDAENALSALQDGDFETARKESAAVLEDDDDNPYGRLTRAVTQYRETMSQLFADMQTAVLAAAGLGRFNEKYLRAALTQAESELKRVGEDLAAATHPDISLDLCLGCWERDWNHDGRIDETDEWIMAIDLDAQGRTIPAGDERRRPTFRFDVGDVVWAGAFVQFHRAVLDLALAFQWSELAKQLIEQKDPEQFVIALVDASRVAEARQRILEGIELAEKSRALISAEIDDDREWLPNPKQRDHPIPMPVDEKLYATWGGLLGDVRRLVKGEEGVSVAEIVDIAELKCSNLPPGYISIGKMFDTPNDIVIEMEAIDDLDSCREPAIALNRIFGDSYIHEMKPSPILRRAARMKDEVDRGVESIERKLRYLIWLN